MRGLAAILTFTLVAFGASACGGGSSGATRALEEYGDALENADYSRAYSMMSEGFRAKHSKEEFIRMVKENKREVSETAARLRGSPSKVEITAEFTYGLGDTMRLVQEGSRWRIAANPMAFYSQSTPREALRSFVRAYNLKRWDVMLRFVPQKYAERMTVEKIQKQFEGPQNEEVATRIHMIEANLDQQIVEKGNKARMPYGDRYEVKFVREENRWKVRDID